MAKVFTGRVAIPGKKIGGYFQIMAAAEEARRPFREYLEGLNQEFTGYMTGKFSESMIKKYAGIVDMFIEFLVRYTDVERIDEITLSIAHAHFQKWYKRKVSESTSPEELKVALREFFTFLSQEKEITNEQVLGGLGDK